jgi:cytidylate kinase
VSLRFRRCSEVVAITSGVSSPRPSVTSTPTARSFRRRNASGEGSLDLIHVTEAKPGLLERVRANERHYATAVEAVLLAIAARDNVVVCGRGAAFFLGRFPHVFRVRVTAPEGVRAQRVQQHDGLVYAAALNLVRRDDRERGARIRFLYHVDWDDPLLYHIVLNTEQISVERGVQILRAALSDAQFTAMPETREKLTDESINAQAKAILRANSLTRPFQLVGICYHGHLIISGVVERDDQREAAEKALRVIPGVTGVLNEIVVRRPVPAAGV